MPCTRQEARQHGDEVRGNGALAHVLRAEVHRRAQVQQEPGVDFAILVVLADVGRLQARGDVPVYVPDVVVILVFAQVGEVEPEPAEKGPVIAVQQPVETADHRPFEPLQDELGIGAAGWRCGSGRAAGCGRSGCAQPAEATRTWVSSGFAGAGTCCITRWMIWSGVIPSASAS